MVLQQASRSQRDRGLGKSNKGVAWLYVAGLRDLRVAMEVYVGD